jgi:urea transport system substrate-binding protein
VSKTTTDEPIRIGLLFSTTGVASTMESSMMKASLFAVEEINDSGGVNGRELQAVHYDPGSKNSNYREYADRLITEDKVKIILGCYMSSSRKAVLTVVERQNALLMYPAQYEGFEFSRNIIYTGAAPNQNSRQLGEYLLQNVGTRFYMVGSDYIWPWEADRVMSEMLDNRSGSVVGERYLKLDAKRKAFDTLVRDIKKQSPDAIFCNFVGESITHFYQAYAEAGLDSKTMPIASLTTSETDIQAMGNAAGKGHYTAATYFQSVDNPVNKTAVSRYQDRYGASELTNMCWDSAYFQVHVLANAIRNSGSEDREVLCRSILGMELDAPQGRVRIDPDNHHTYVWPRVGRAMEDGQFEILVEPSQSVKPDPYLANHYPNRWATDTTTKTV